MLDDETAALVAEALAWLYPFDDVEDGPLPDVDLDSDPECGLW